MSYAQLSRLPPLTGKNISRISNRAASSLHHGLTQTTTKDDTGVILYINKDNCHKQHKDGQKLTHRSPKKQNKPAYCHAELLATLSQKKPRLTFKSCTCHVPTQLYE